MKSSSYLFLALIVTLCLSVFGCTKSNPTLVAKWKLKNMVMHQHKNAGGDTSATYVGGPNDYFDFRNDGRLYIHSDSLFGNDTSTYVISGSNVTATNIATGSTPTTLAIQGLTNSSVSLYQKITDSTGYLEQTINLIR